jgi:transposase
MDKVLPVDVATLQTMVRELHAQAEDRELRAHAHESVIAAQREELRRAQQKIDWLLRKLFARASEKLDPAQLRIDFGEAMAAVQAAEEPAEATLETAAPDDETQPARRQGAHGRKPLPPTVERRRVEVPPETTTCDLCAQELVRIGEETSEELDYEPARFVAIEHVRGKYACRHCETVAPTSPAPPRPIERARPSAKLLAFVLVAKYQDHLPLARLERIFLRDGVEIARSTLCDWVGDAAELLAPVVRAIRAEVLTADVIQGDDTPVLVQENATRGKSRQGYLWVYRDLLGATFFDFRMSRSRDGPADVLADWRGHLVCDAYQGYHGLFKQGRVVPVGCWAHARRRFFDAFKAGDVDAALVLTLIARMYAVEKDAKQRGLDGDSVRALRQERTAPEIERIRLVLEHLAKDALPRSALGDAVAYTRNQWANLTRFLDDGRLPLDNNASERAVRGVAVGRKNWLFAGGEEGGHRAAALYSIVESCKSAGIEPVVYLRDVLTRVANTPASQVAALTPRAWAAARR